MLQRTSAPTYVTIVKVTSCVIAPLVFRPWFLILGQYKTSICRCLNFNILNLQSRHILLWHSACQRTNNVPSVISLVVLAACPYFNKLFFKKCYLFLSCFCPPIQGFWYTVYYILYDIQLSSSSTFLHHLLNFLLQDLYLDLDPGLGLKYLLVAIDHTITRVNTPEFVLHCVYPKNLDWVRTAAVIPMIHLPFHLHFPLSLFTYRV